MKRIIILTVTAAILAIAGINAEAAKPKRVAKRAVKTTKSAATPYKGHPTDKAFFLVKGPVKTLYYEDAPIVVSCDMMLGGYNTYNFDREGCFIPSDKWQRRKFHRDAEGRIVKFETSPGDDYIEKWSIGWNSRGDKIDHILSPDFDRGYYFSYDNGVWTGAVRATDGSNSECTLGNMQYDSHGNWVSCTDQDGNHFTRTITYWED